jgi:hypothetical protein
MASESSPTEPRTGDDDAPFSQWLNEVRARDPVGPNAKESAPSEGPFRRNRMLGLGLLFICAGAALYFGILSPKPTPAYADVKGVVQDGSGRPLANAIVFLAPGRGPETYCGVDGSFELKGVPTGAQTLVVVSNEVGQEFPAILRRAAINNVGNLRYTAPADG